MYIYFFILIETIARVSRPPPRLVNANWYLYISEWACTLHTQEWFVSPAFERTTLRNVIDGTSPGHRTHTHTLVTGPLSASPPATVNLFKMSLAIVPFCTKGVISLQTILSTISWKVFLTLCLRRKATDRCGIEKTHGEHQGWEKRKLCLTIGVEERTGGCWEASEIFRSGAFQPSGDISGKPDAETGLPVRYERWRLSRVVHPVSLLMVQLGVLLRPVIWAVVKGVQPSGFCSPVFSRFLCQRGWWCGRSAQPSVPRGGNAGIPLRRCWCCCLAPGSYSSFSYLSCWHWPRSACLSRHRRTNELFLNAVCPHRFSTNDLWTFLSRPGISSRLFAVKLERTALSSSLSLTL